MDMLGKALHVGISVYNMEQSLQWYKQVLGFRLIKDDGYIPLLHARVCFLGRDEFQIELFQYDNPVELPKERLEPNTDLQTVGTKHVAFGVRNMNAVKETLLAEKVDIAHEVKMGADHVLFIRDCKGVLNELIEESRGDE